MREIILAVFIWWAGLGLCIGLIMSQSNFEEIAWLKTKKRQWAFTILVLWPWIILFSPFILKEMWGHRQRGLKMNREQVRE